MHASLVDDAKYHDAPSKGVVQVQSAPKPHVSSFWQQSLKGWRILMYSPKMERIIRRTIAIQTNPMH